jgi:A/G-specific adenine glycosylase
VKKVDSIIAILLKWFAANARDLPWRRTRDPYAIWVSEIMLQQTQVKTVIPYWERWMRELPTIESLAHASAGKIHKLWEGLGYYTRVRNLQKGAQQITIEHSGKFPKTFDDVLALPGIGRYTAGAICSIAFNQPRAILDGNVVRVLTRIFGIATDPREKDTTAQLWRLAEELVTPAHERWGERPREPHSRNSKAARRESRPTSACSHLNQSLMELGALICTPRSPQCDVCPVSRHCVARKKGLQDQLPNLGKRETATARRFIAFVVERDGKFLVRQRPAGVVNAHLWEFPKEEIGARVCDPQLFAAKKFGLRTRSAQPFCTIKHSITRYRITLEAWHAELASSNGAPVSDPARSKTATRNAPGRKPAFHGEWRTLAELQQLAFTSAHRKILHALNA